MAGSSTQSFMRTISSQYNVTVLMFEQTDSIHYYLIPFNGAYMMDWNPTSPITIHVYIGMIIGEIGEEGIFSDSELDGKSFNLSTVSVNDAYRGKGIAQKLIELMEVFAKEKGYEIIYLEDASSNFGVPEHNIYTKMGYVIDAVEPTRKVKSLI